MSYHDERVARDLADEEAAEQKRLAGTHERRIKALESLLPQAVNDLIYKDPHSWSTRGCRTCAAITNMIGTKFGCIRYAAEMRTKKS